MGALFYAVIGLGTLWLLGRGGNGSGQVAGRPPPMDLGAAPNPRAPKVVNGDRVSDLLAMLDNVPASLRGPAMRAVVFGDPEMLRARGEELVDAGYGTVGGRLLERADVIEAMG